MRRLKAELQLHPPQARRPRYRRRLPYWQKLIAQFPTSPYAPEALDHAANLQLARDEWKPAAENLDKLVKDYPASPWSGDAYVALIDIKLERLLDLEGAQKLADAAVKWYEANSPLPSGEGQGEGSRREGGTTSRLAPGEGQGEGAKSLALRERVRVRAGMPRNIFRAPCRQGPRRSSGVILG